MVISLKCGCLVRTCRWLKATSVVVMPPLRGSFPRLLRPECSVGFLNFPLDSQLSTWTGFVTIGWGILTVLAYMSRPEWFESRKPLQPVSV